MKKRKYMLLLSASLALVLGQIGVQSGYADQSCPGAAGTFSTLTRAGNHLTFVAADNTNEDLSIDFSIAEQILTFSDVGGTCISVDNAPGCSQGTVNSRVTCQAAEISTVSVDTKELDDIVDYRASIDASLMGGSGNDSLKGGTGNDTLQGDEGTDTLFGRGGDDTFKATGGVGLSPHDGSSDVMNGGNGADSADYSLRDADLSLSLDGLANDGQAGENDSLLLVENLRSGAGIDTLTGDDQANVLDAGQGGTALTPQVVNAGGGADQITTGNGNDNINAGGGDDTINAGDGGNTVNSGDAVMKDTVTTGSGDDSITTGSGSDVVKAGDGNNGVTTGDGKDDVTTGGGDDSVMTGDGADTIKAGDGNDDIDAGDGDDTIDAGGGNDGTNLDPLLAGPGKDTVRGGLGNDNISGGNGDDTIHGDTGANTGADGNDVISGGDDKDTLWGDNGHDRLFGDAPGGGAFGPATPNPDHCDGEGGVDHEDQATCEAG